MRHALPIAFITGILCSSCMHALREPAMDHAIQADEVARRCHTPIAAGGYTDSPCSDDLQRALDELAKSARCIDAIANAEPCE